MCPICTELNKERQKSLAAEKAKDRVNQKDLTISKKMDLKQLEDVMKDQEQGGSMQERKENVVSNMKTDPKDQEPLDSGRALQKFLDHIPISSIHGIKNSPVVELKAGDGVKDAIQLLYDKNVFVALIADDANIDTTIGRSSSNRYIGIIYFANMVLWSLEECKKAGNKIKDKSSFFSMLDENPQIGQTKVGELAKAFLWDPFFPVHLEDTLFHVLLLLSKHRVQVVPVIDQSNSDATNFVTQNVVVQVLLQSNGLEWFDAIADRPLSEFCFEERVVLVYGDQSLDEALDLLWQSRTGAVAVVNRGSKSIIGCLRDRDVCVLLINNKILADRKTLTMEEFIHLETAKKESEPTFERDLGTPYSDRTLQLRSSFLPRMDSPVTNKSSNTLKQAMKDLAETESTVSFLVNDSQQPTGMITVKDVIAQFAPPGVDSSFHGGGFFESALEQAGCHVQNGAIVHNHRRV